MTVQLNIDAILRAIGTVAPQTLAAPGGDFAALMKVSTQDIAPSVPGVGSDGSAPPELLAPSADGPDVAAQPNPEAPLPPFRMPVPTGQTHVPVLGSAIEADAQPAPDRGVVPLPKTVTPIPVPLAKSPRAKIDVPEAVKDERESDAGNPIDEEHIPKIAGVLSAVDPTPVTPGQVPDKADPHMLVTPGLPIPAAQSVPCIEHNVAAAEPDIITPMLRPKPGAHVQLHLRRVDLPVAQAAAPDKGAPPVAAATELRAMLPFAEHRQSIEPLAGNSVAVTTDTSTHILAPAARGDMAGDAGSPSTSDRAAALFSVQIAALARDVVVVGAERDVRFNLRPEMLGPVAVTIERRDDGPTLRLGVETPAAVQAVRQAEPALTDAAARTGSPFVQVSVDLQSPGQRDRPARAASLIKRGRDDVLLAPIEPAVVTSGRFA